MVLRNLFDLNHLFNKSDRSNHEFRIYLNKFDYEIISNQDSEKTKSVLDMYIDFMYKFKSKKRPRKVKKEG